MIRIIPETANAPFCYFYGMKKTPQKQPSKTEIRHQILYSAIASFRIEGIIVTEEQGINVLKKVEASLGK